MSIFSAVHFFILVFFIQLQEVLNCSTDVSSGLFQLDFRVPLNLNKKELSVYAFKVCLKGSMLCSDGTPLESRRAYLVAKSGHTKRTDGIWSDGRGCAEFLPNDYASKLEDVDSEDIRVAFEMKKAPNDLNQYRVEVTASVKEFSDEVIPKDTEFPLTLIRNKACSHEECTFLETGKSDVIGRQYVSLNYISDTGVVSGSSVRAAKTLVVLKVLPPGVTSASPTNPDCRQRNLATELAIPRGWIFSEDDKISVGAFEVCIPGTVTCIPPPNTLHFSGGRRLNGVSVSMSKKGEDDEKKATSKALEVVGDKRCAVFSPCEILKTGAKRGSTLKATVTTLASSSVVTPTFSDIEEYKTTITRKEGLLTVLRRGYCDENTCKVNNHNGKVVNYDFIKQGGCLTEDRATADTTLMVITDVIDPLELAEVTTSTTVPTTFTGATKPTTFTGATKPTTFTTPMKPTKPTTRPNKHYDKQEESSGAAASIGLVLVALLATPFFR